MNTFQLSCFLEVADMLNFARAAERLHVTQPAVTQQIRSLENELNVRLFNRTTRSVKLTEEGLVFLHDARHIVAISERAKKRFENPYGREVRTLSLGCHSFAQLFMLPPALKQLASQHPDVHPRLHVVPFQHLYRLLEEDEVEAVIGFREPESKKIAAVYRELKRVPIACFCVPENPLSKRGSATMEDLKGEPLVLFDPGKAQSDVAELQGRLMGGRSPADFYFCESMEAVIMLTLAGSGIAVMPELLVPRALPLARVPIEGVGTASFGVYYKTLQGNAPLRDLVQILREQAQETT